MSWGYPEPSWQFCKMSWTLKVDNFTLWPWLFKNIFLKVDNCTLLMWSFLTIFRHGHDISKNFLEGWQFYTMAVTFFDKFLQWLWCIETIWQFYSFFPHFYFDNFPPWSCLHLSGATNLWKNFPVKIICRYNLTIFHPGCE